MAGVRHLVFAARPLPLSPSHIAGPGGWGDAFTGKPPWEPLAPNDVRRRWTRHLLAVAVVPVTE